MVINTPLFETPCNDNGNPGEEAAIEYQLNWYFPKRKEDKRTCAI